MLTGFGFDFGLGFGVFRIGGAGKHEVLPDHDAVAVAQIVEFVGFVDAASPHAHHVGIGFHKVSNAALVIAVRHSCDERVVGNPVVAVGVHRHVVDVDLERTAHVVGAGIDMHRTEADAAVPGGVLAGFGGISGGHGDVVQRLFAVAQRPPQLRFRYLNRQYRLVTAFRDRTVDGDFRAEAADHGMHRHCSAHGMGIIRRHDAALAGTLDFNMHVEQTGSVRGNAHQRAYRNDARVGPGVDADLTPDAGVGHVDAPIPTEGVARLADLIECMMLGVRIVAAGLFHAVGFANRRSEGDGQLVGAFAKQITHVPAVGTVEVARGCDRTAVQRDVGDGVETVGNQIVAVVSVVMPFENAGETPIDVANPLLVVFVGPVERLGDQSGVEQVERSFSRHGCRNASGDGFAQRFGCGLRVDRRQRPAFAERGERAGNVRHCVVLFCFC